MTAAYWEEFALNFTDEVLLTPDLTEAILTSLGFSERPSKDLDGLRSIYSAWCKKVPFDNLRKLIHLKTCDTSALPGDDAIDFFQSWLKYGTGGTCWAGNGALHALLTSLGFSACRGVATMLAAPNLPPNHGTVIVEYEKTMYLLDASILHLVPLPMLNAVKTDNPGGGVELRKVKDNWQIHWRPLHMPDGLECRIDYFPASSEDFQARHEQTRDWSPFNFELYFRTLSGNDVVGIANGRRMELNAREAISSEVLSLEQRATILIDELGVSEEIVNQLPPDRPTPPPPGSKTAGRVTANL